MSIDRHVEDAMKHLGKKFGGDGPDSRDILQTVFQAAIDEAAAPLGVEIACQSMELGTLAGIIDKLQQRIAELEGLGPLIPTLSRWGGYAVDEGWDDESDVTAILTKINAILKGGAK